MGLENILLNLILIPRWSLFGAALGTSISEVLVAGALMVLAGEMRGRLHVRRIVTGAVLGSAAAAAVMVPLNDSLLPSVPLGIVAYFAVLLTYERLAFPQDFSVIHELIGQARARLAGASGEAA